MQVRAPQLFFRITMHFRNRQYALRVYAGDTMFFIANRFATMLNVTTGVQHNTRSLKYPEGNVTAHRLTLFFARFFSLQIEFVFSVDVAALSRAQTSWSSLPMMVRLMSHLPRSVQQGPPQRHSLSLRLRSELIGWEIFLRSSRAPARFVVVQSLTSPGEIRSAPLERMGRAVLWNAPWR